MKTKQFGAHLTSTDNMFVGKKYTASGLFERKWTYLK